MLPKPGVRDNGKYASLYQAEIVSAEQEVMRRQVLYTSLNCSPPRLWAVPMVRVAKFGLHCDILQRLRCIESGASDAPRGSIMSGVDGRGS